MKYLTPILTGFFALIAVTSCSGPMRSPGPTVPEPVSKVQPPAPHPKALKENLFVLVPDPDGRTGSIALGNKQGSQIIAEPGLASVVRDAATPPAPPKRMDEEEIQRIFGAALSALPGRPGTFLLYFKNGSTDLAGESVQTIPLILKVIDAKESGQIIVVGHTDRVGTRQKNLILSRNRAERIKELLISGKVDPHAIEIKWCGKDDPLIKTPDEVPEPRNRRVEVTVR